MSYPLRSLMEIVDREREFLRRAYFNEVYLRSGTGTAQLRLTQCGAGICVDRVDCPEAGVNLDDTFHVVKRIEHV